MEPTDPPARSPETTPPQPPRPQSPPPSQREAAINADEAPSPGSSTASARASRPASAFIEDPGPGFDPDAAAPGPEPDPHAELHALPELIGWEEETVQQLLNAQGELLHSAVGVAEQDWLHTAADLKAIGGPLTRILNRYPATAAAAAMGDPVALALGVAGYGVRSARERAEVLRMRAEQEEVPITGAPAPPGSGPPPENQRTDDEPEWRIG